MLCGRHGASYHEASSVSYLYYIEDISETVRMVRQLSQGHITCAPGL
jgi:hypothetical protein